VLATAVRTDSQWLTRLRPTDTRTIELRAMLRLRDELVTDKARLVMRLRAQLWRYYAQMLELADGELDSRWLWALLEKASTPKQGAALSRAVVARMLRDHRVQRLDADEVRAILKKPSLVVADGVEKAGAIHVRSIITRLRLLDEQVRATSSSSSRSGRSSRRTRALPLPRRARRASRPKMKHQVGASSATR